MNRSAYTIVEFLIILLFANSNGIAMYNSAGRSRGAAITTANPTVKGDRAATTVSYVGLEIAPYLGELAFVANFFSPDPNMRLLILETNIWKDSVRVRGPLTGSGTGSATNRGWATRARTPWNLAIQPGSYKLEAWFRVTNLSGTIQPFISTESGSGIGTGKEHCEISTGGTWGGENVVYCWYRYDLNGVNRTASVAQEASNPGRFVTRHNCGSQTLVTVTANDSVLWGTYDSNGVPQSTSMNQAIVLEGGGTPGPTNYQRYVSCSAAGTTTINVRFGTNQAIISAVTVTVVASDALPGRPSFLPQFTNLGSYPRYCPPNGTTAFGIMSFLNIDPSKPPECYIPRPSWTIQAYLDGATWRFRLHNVEINYRLSVFNDNAYNGVLKIDLPRGGYTPPLEIHGLIVPYTLEQAFIEARADFDVNAYRYWQDPTVPPKPWGTARRRYYWSSDVSLSHENFHVDDFRGYYGSAHTANTVADRGHASVESMAVPFNSLDANTTTAANAVATVLNTFGLQTVLNGIFDTESADHISIPQFNGNAEQRAQSYSNIDYSVMWNYLQTGPPRSSRE